MKVEIKIPKVGESIVEGFLATWNFADGSGVSEGQPIFELETDKTTLEVSAPARGRLIIEVPAQTDVRIGQVVGYIDTEAAGEAVSEGEAPPPPASQAPPAAPQAPSAAPPSAPSSPPPTPSALLQARLRRLDLTSIAGTGKGGRVSKADLPDAVSKVPKLAPPQPERIPFSTESERREPLSRIRKKIAENLSLTKNSMVLLSTFNEVDMSRIKTLRAQYKNEFAERHGTKLGFMSFFLKASTTALRAYPAINAYIDGDQVVYRDHVHISVAVSTPKGLITPVLRFVDQKTFAAIEHEIIGFSKRAIEKKLGPDELTGGTFTITNGGVFGSLLSTPLPSPKQSAILGMHSIQDRPVAIKGEVTIRPMMYLALSYDHRLVDGREAVGFLKTIKQTIEEPERLLLDLA